jgi:hypothetical protein
LTAPRKVKQDENCFPDQSVRNANKPVINKSKNHIKFKLFFASQTLSKYLDLHCIALVFIENGNSQIVYGLNLPVINGDEDIICFEPCFLCTTTTFNIDPLFLP